MGLQSFPSSNNFFEIKYAWFPRKKIRIYSSELNQIKSQPALSFTCVVASNGGMSCCAQHKVRNCYTEKRSFPFFPQYAINYTYIQSLAFRVTD